MARVTHKWVGEPHASESIKRIDGVEVARNYVPNPSFELDTSGWTGSSVDIERSSEWSASGDYSVKSIPSGTSLDSRIDISGFGSLPAGTYTMRGTIRLAKPQGDRQHTRARRLMVFHREPGGSLISYQSEQAPNEVGEHDLELTFTIPEGHTDQIFRLYHGEDRDSGTGGPVWWDAVSITAESHYYFDGDTEDYETSRFKTYTNGLWVPAQAKQFDGDSWVPAEARRGVSVSVTHEWTGTPHASESIKRVNGVEVARNLLLNPSFEAGIDEGRESGVIAEQSGLWAADGNHSLKLSTSSTTTADSHYEYRPALPDPGTYTARGTIRLDRPQGDTQHGSRARCIAVFTREPGGSYTETRSAMPPNTAGEHHVEVTFDVPEGHTEQLVRLYHGENNTSSNSVWWDAVAITAEPSDYFDGRTEDYDTVSFSDP